MVPDTVNSMAGRFGIPAQALAILMIIFGILIILLPHLLPWLVGILLIVMGVLWLVGSTGGGFRMGAGAPREPAGPPPRV